MKSFRDILQKPEDLELCLVRFAAIHAILKGWKNNQNDHHRTRIFLLSRSQVSGDRAKRKDVLILHSMCFTIVSLTILAREQRGLYKCQWAQTKLKYDNQTCTIELWYKWINKKSGTRVCIILSICEQHLTSGYLNIWAIILCTFESCTFILFFELYK